MKHSAPVGATYPRIGREPYLILDYLSLRALTAREGGEGGVVSRHRAHALRYSMSPLAGLDAAKLSYVAYIRAL